MTDEYEDVTAFFTDSSNYLESLIRSRQHLANASASMRKMLDETIAVELELALIGAKKARAAVLKEQAKNNVVPLKKSPDGGTAA